MNTNFKYRPKTIDEFVFANERLESRIRRYTDGKTTIPLVLHGTHGTGKSLLAELIPKSIEGKDRISINNVHAEDLNNSAEVRKKFYQNKDFDRHFTIGDQKNNYTVIQEVNFDPKAKGALRACLDDMSDKDLFIFTTNEVEKIDQGLLSRAEVIEVPPAPPEMFLARAKFILSSEGLELADAELLDLLESVYSDRSDNRAYYQALDRVIDSAFESPTQA